MQESDYNYGGRPGGRKQGGGDREGPIGVNEGEVCCPCGYHLVDSLFEIAEYCRGGHSSGRVAISRGRDDTSILDQSDITGGRGRPLSAEREGEVY